MSWYSDYTDAYPHAGWEGVHLERDAGPSRSLRGAYQHTGLSMGSGRVRDAQRPCHGGLGTRDWSEFADGSEVRIRGPWQWHDARMAAMDRARRDDSSWEWSNNCQDHSNYWVSGRKFSEDRDRLPGPVNRFLSGWF